MLYSHYITDYIHYKYTYLLYNAPKRKAHNLSASSLKLKAEPDV